MGVPVDPRLRVPPRPVQPIATPRVLGDPQDFREVSIQQIGETADGSQTHTQQRIGFNGTLVSAIIVNIGNNDIKPADAWGQATVYRGLFQDPELAHQNRLYSLCRGPITQNRGPAGFGSLPVQAGDLLNFTTWFLTGGQWGLKMTGLPGPVLSPTQWYGQFLEPEEVPGRPSLQVDETLNDNDKTLTVTTNTSWVIHSIRIEYTSDGTGATREIEVNLRDTANDIIYGVEVGEQSTSQTGIYQMGPMWRTTTQAAGDAALDAGDGASGSPDVTALLPWDYKQPLDEGFNVRFFDAVDNSSSDDMIIQMMVEERLLAQ